MNTRKPEPCEINDAPPMGDGWKIPSNLGRYETLSQHLQALKKTRDELDKVCESLENELFFLALEKLI